MALSDLYIQPQGYPEDLQRGRINRVRCPVYTPGGELATVTAGTLIVRDSGGLARVDGAAVTVDSDGPYYDIPADAVPAALVFEEGWQLVWSLTIGGEVHTFDRDAALVARMLHPVIRDEDVIGSLGGAGGSHILAKIAGSPRRAGVGLRPEREEAWKDIRCRLLSVQRWPALVLSPWALRTCHLELTRCKVLAGADIDLPGADYREKAQDAWALYEAAWASLTFTYDEGGQGQVSDSASGMVPARRPIALGTYQPRDDGGVGRYGTAVGRW